MKEKTFENKRGIVEVYCDDGDPIGYADIKEANRVGLYINSRFGDSNVYEGASLAMSPKMAKEVAARMIAIAEAIENRKKK